MSAATPVKRFYGWRIVWIGALGQAISIGTTIATFTLFVPVLVQDFGSTLAEVGWVIALMNFSLTASGPLLAPFIDRLSIRWVMAAGALINGLCLLLASRATEIWQLTVLIGLGAGLGTNMLGPLSSATVVAKWFERDRGRAQGLTFMGGPLGGLFFAPIAGLAIGALGWRGTLVAFALLTLLSIPLVLAVIRNRPEELGLRPDGDPEGASTAAATAAEAGAVVWSPRELFGLREFWNLAAPVGLFMGASLGYVASYGKFAEDLGIARELASGLLGLSAGLGILGAIVLGRVADRVSPRALMIAIVALHALVFGIFRTQPGMAAFVAGVAIIGFVGGAFTPVYMASIGRLFGGASFGLVMGLAGLLTVPFTTLAPRIAGSLRDSSGTYVSTFDSLLLALALVTLGLWILPEKPPKPARSPAALAPS
jgi:MFS family permease